LRWARARRRLRTASAMPRGFTGDAGACGTRQRGVPEPTRIAGNPTVSGQHLPGGYGHEGPANGRVLIAQRSRLWSRRSRVRVPSLTPHEAPANERFVRFCRRFEVAQGYQWGKRRRRQAVMRRHRRDGRLGTRDDARGDRPTSRWRRARAACQGQAAQKAARAAQALDGRFRSQHAFLSEPMLTPSAPASCPASRTVGRLRARRRERPRRAIRQLERLGQQLTLQPLVQAADLLSVHFLTRDVRRGPPSDGKAR
jgi:hypothetical protein